MPPTIRPDAVILEALLTAVLEEGLVTDIAPISVLRMLLSGVATTTAELYYSLYTLYRSFFLQMARGEDLDVRGTDLGLPRDPGQAASGSLEFTRAPTYFEDIPLAAPQTVQAVVEPGTTPVTYSTMADAVLQPQGRSVSGEAPLTNVVGGVNDAITLTINGDGPQTVRIGTQATGEALAAALTAAVRGLFAVTPALQPAYDLFRADWNQTTVGAFTFRSGTTGPTSTVVVVSGTQPDDASPFLKLGLAQGGKESPGMDVIRVPLMADVRGVLGNVGARQLTQQVSAMGGIGAVTNPLPLVNGREAWSDDAYVQAIQAHLLGLGRGGATSIVQAAQATRLSDGSQPVQSVQVLPDGNAHVRVFVSDGRSRTLGAQPDVVEAVQRELDGRGSTASGWIASGVTALVRPCVVRVVDVTATVLVGPLPDLGVAQRLCIQAIVSLLSAASVGQTVGYVTMLRAIDQAVAEVLRVDFQLPMSFRVSPPHDLVVTAGLKLMPGTIQVGVRRG